MLQIDFACVCGGGGGGGGLVFSKPCLLPFLVCTVTSFVPILACSKGIISSSERNIFLREIRFFFPSKTIKTASEM